MARQYFRGVLGKNCKFQFNVILVMRSTWKFFFRNPIQCHIYICIRNGKCLEKIQILIQYLLIGLK